MEDQMIIAQCHYTMPDGHQCGSPALRGQDYCYFHHPGSKPRTRKPRSRYPKLDLAALASIDNPRAIQQTLAAVLHALAANTISLYQAQTMIYALQLASNLSR
jgi:hypothetical protein